MATTEMNVEREATGERIGRRVRTGDPTASLPRPMPTDRRLGDTGRRADAPSPDRPPAAQTMRAAWCPRYGAPERLEVRDVPLPEPAAGELLVRVHASATTAADTMIRRGTPFYGRAFIGLLRPRHPIPGTGFAGVVEATGEGVTAFEVGQAVFGETGLGFSANAEYLTIPVDGVVLEKPDALPFDEAVVACDGAVTALCLLADTAELAAGERVLVNGAAGAQGVAAVQIAKRLGAHVTAVASAANAEYVTALGADATIDYNARDFAASDERWDVIYDTVGTRRFSDVRVALADGGRYVSGVLSLGLLASLLWTGRVGSRRARFAATGLQPAPILRERLGQVADMITEGGLELPIEGRYPLSDIADAQRRIEGGHKRGNLVIETVAPADRETVVLPGGAGGTPR